MAFKINLNNLLNILKNLSKDYSIFVPASENNRIKLKKFDGKNFYTGTELPINNTKELVLPQRDCMLKYKWEKEIGYKGEEIKPENKKSIVFCKPCDAHAVNIIDKIFLNNKEDNYYKDKRENLIVISVGCITSSKTCFCTTVGGSPFNENGCDIFSFFKDDSFVFKGITDKGISIIKNFKGIEVDDEIFAEEKNNVEKNVLKDSIKIQELKENANSKFEDKIWKELGETCIGCGACTYLCPACHCFDIQEEVKKNTGLRVRNWDSCQFSLFTKEASGHNPRASAGERMRQRFEHKLSYIPENNNEIGCVGCGRCVVYCPVNIDIREVVERIME